MTDTLARLQYWYANRCDGEWEHTYGINIDTLDNPGWTVRINLSRTAWEKTHFEAVVLDRGPVDWINCVKEGAEYLGSGDPTKLEMILEHFLTQVDCKRSP